MNPPIVVPPESPEFHVLGDDLLVHAVAVQGGEVAVAEQATPFVRIGMIGVPVAELDSGLRMAQRGIGAVLNPDQADELAFGLRAIMAREPWGAAALANPARALWTETSELSQGDMLLANVTASSAELHFGGETVQLVRLDLTGVWLGESSSEDRPLHVQGALFPDAGQLSALISSLKKCAKAVRGGSTRPGAEPAGGEAP
ncbi:MAG: hypothetical protein ABR972_02510 [Acidimicrobiales bacterium]|jgi:hypothetical protein